MKKTFISLFLILLAVVLILGACAKTTTTPPATTQPTTTAPTSPTTTAKPTTTTPTTPTPKYGGILKIANAQAQGTLGDPGTTLKSDQIMRSPAMERLGNFNASAQLEPFLAESWQTDAQANTFTVKLKKGINFQDDTPFNAAAVKWNWDRLQSVKHADMDGVTSINVLDDSTVQVKLAKWDNSIVYKLIYDAGGMVSPTAWTKNGVDWGKLNPVGTGPFKLVSSVAGTSISYEKWNGYWQKGKPYLDGIQFIIIPDQSNRQATFMAGGVDIVINITALEAKTLVATGKYRINALKTGIGTGNWYIAPSGKNPDSPWAKVEVRQALSHALDIDSLIKNLNYGYCSPTNQWGSSKNWAYNPNVKGYPFNPTKAKELLTKAGYPNGFNSTFYIDPAGVPFSEAIQTMLANVGIKVTIQSLDRGGMFTLKTSKGWEGMIMATANPDGDVAMRLRWNVRSDAPDIISMYRSPEIDAMIDAALAAPDFATKQSLTWKEQAYFMDTLALWTPVWVSDGLFAAYPKVHDDGFGIINGDAFTPYDVWME